MKGLLIATALFLVSQLAFSKPVELVACNDVGASLESILFGSKYQKTYYNGNVGLVVYDTIEPAAASYGIAIVHNEPVETHAGFISRKCLAVSYLSGVDLSAARSTYDAKAGLTVIVPVRKMDGITGLDRDTKIKINIKTVNTGKIDEGHVVTAEEI